MMLSLAPDVCARLDEIEAITGEPALEQVHAAVAAWTSLPARVVEAIVEVEKAYCLTRPQALATCLAAGANELTAAYVQRLLDDVYGRDGERA